MFSQISDSSGFMDHDRFADFLQQVLALPTAVFEAPTFGFNEGLAGQCFAKVGQYNVIEVEHIGQKQVIYALASLFLLVAIMSFAFNATSIFYFSRPFPV